MGKIMDAVMDRLREPSTWAGMATILIAVGQAFPEVGHNATGAASVMGALAVALKEAKGA